MASELGGLLTKKEDRWKKIDRIASKFNSADDYIERPKMLSAPKYISDTEVQSVICQWLERQASITFLHRTFRNLLTDGITV